MFRSLAAAAKHARPSATPSLFFSTDARPPPRVKRRYCNTFIQDDAKPFIRPNGCLYTSTQVKDFLTLCDLDWDTSKMWYIDRSPDSSLFTRLGVSPRFTGRHMVAGKDLKFLNPAGHPLQDAWMATAAHEARTRPLWVWATVPGDAKAVVRQSATRGLKSLLWSALEASGYDMHGRAAQGSGKRDLKGTLWMHVVDPLKVFGEGRDRFGIAMVQELERQTAQNGQRPQQPRDVDGPRYRPGGGPAGARGGAGPKYRGPRDDNTPASTSGRSFRPRDSW